MNAHKTRLPFRRRLFSLLKWLSIGMTVISVIALLSIIVYVFADGIDKLSLHLLFGAYTEDAPSILPALVGTLELVLIAGIIAVPLGIGSAVFLVEYTDNIVTGKIRKIEMREISEKELGLDLLRPKR